MIQIIHGDCLLELPRLDADRFDSCVTDPPYHLTSIVKRFGAENAAPAKAGKTGAYQRASAGFMGKVWDGGDVAFRPETWAEVLRVLKPGAHMVAFGGTRTFHRMACAIEDAGFEVRDTLCWLYGSGFRKSHNISKGIDRAAGVEREVTGTRPLTGKARVLRGGNFTGDYGERELTTEYSETAPATEAARQWSGWGSALKPAIELIILARKPLGEKTIVANVLRHGTGGLNIDECRVKLGIDDVLQNGIHHNGHVMDTGITEGAWGFRAVDRAPGFGRWPSNVLHDGSEEVLEGFPQSTSSAQPRHNGAFDSVAKGHEYPHTTFGHSDSGSAARFFKECRFNEDEKRFHYTSKADAKDRADSKHPTVKPTDLMRWLIRLITPSGGTVLDPFCGTGSTLIAADQLQFSAVGIEQDEQYAIDARRKFRQDAGLFADATEVPDSERTTP